MLVFRLTLPRFADSLVASGTANRWNSAGRLVIYTAFSRSLACLEKVVHTRPVEITTPLRMLLIDVPDELTREELPALPAMAQTSAENAATRALGDEWLDSQRSVILAVPSAIIPQEINYLLNPAHPDFARIQLVGTEDFRFDSRLKE